jgi:glutamate formiminotransferase / 5-formyltetrahydrofolate cyclo-ligase
VLEPLHPLQQGQEFVRRSAARHGGIEQAARFRTVATPDGCRPVVEQRLGLALPLGLRAAGALDVGAGARVTSIEEQRARPDVYGLVILSGKVVIQPGKQKLLDLRVTFGPGRGLLQARRLGAERIGHESVYEAARIIRQRFTAIYNRHFVIESVPNVSEGQRADVVDELAAALRKVAGLLLLDHSADPSHNRSVFTIAGDSGAVRQGLLNLFEVAVARIDLRTHRGVHPRIGAVDVVPFVPLGETTMAECVHLSREFGAAVAERFGVPVFLYERSATRPERRRLEQIRRHEFEGLTEKLTKPEWLPDFGQPVPHPTAGASVVGARMPLIAFNVHLESADVSSARAIAAVIRESSGGLPGVKALGLALKHRGVAQVSMNLTDYTRTSIQTVFEEVERQADARGIRVLDSELIGLIPAAALEDTSAAKLKLHGFTTSQILEERIAERLGGR